ncbi:nuclear transport factor 2 family protein [Salipiger bermudensis]|uniref:nuclear transport factor 2 family protein n=1 Tax=Salipiger bermudensis TaxID=344736 RepID=UPI001C992900|nr:nuclear transport factor 2 family protein [Salipiger bermudensis]MBY6005632.1 nuclear transport factor 2 family protein [Salipiger bermudensis]
MSFPHLSRPAALTAALLAGSTALAQSPERDITREAANLALVTEFYEGVFLDHDVAAASAVVADSYIQHNPNVPDGKAPFVSYFTGLFAENPAAKNEIVKSAASGDLVWLHVHSTAGADDRGRAIVDIFRVADGMIVEHWDVIQPVPETSANENGMF